MKDGYELIKLIENARKEVNKQKRLVENAEFRISKLGNSADDMWIRMKAEAEAKRDAAQNSLESLMTKFYLLKDDYTSTDWKSLLGILGNMLAETNDINHVIDSKHDEHDLQRALDETSIAIKETQQSLKEAKQSQDNDAVILAEAELGYYEADMRQHHWGEARLEKLKAENVDTITPEM